MTQMIYVGSKSEKSILVPVEESGIDMREVRSRAIQFARARHGVADPIALNEHEAAVRQRLQILAEHAPRMVDLNGHGQPFWRLRGNKYYN